MAAWTLSRNMQTVTLARESWTRSSCWWSPVCAGGTLIGSGRGGNTIATGCGTADECRGASVVTAVAGKPPTRCSAGGAAAAPAQLWRWQATQTPPRCNTPCRAPGYVRFHRTDPVGMGWGSAAGTRAGPRPPPRKGCAQCGLAGLHEVQQTLLVRGRAALANVRRVQVPNRHKENRRGCAVTPQPKRCAGQLPAPRPGNRVL